MQSNIKKFKGTEVELEYLLTGEENKETLMFVHGAGSNLRQFIPQHQHFSSQYKVLSVSLRGHGQSSSAPIGNATNYTLEKNRDDLLELLEHLGLSSLHYVGNSAGGVVGFYLIDAQPQLFKSMVTFGTTAELNYSSFVTGLIAGTDKLMLRLNPRGYLRFLSKNVSKYEDVQKQTYDLFMMSIGAVPYLRRNLGSYSCLDTIINMQIPYLLIQGELDKEINSLLKSTLKSISANSRASVVELREAGHIANLDRPEEFNKTIEDFISSFTIAHPQRPPVYYT